MISVAMTTYNGERYIEEQLHSILNQTVAVDEIIVFDDGSTDKTSRIISQLKNPRIKYQVNEENMGYIKNFYKAIASCSGDFIFLSDQDDIWEPNKVEKMLKVMKETNCEALCTNFSLIDEHGSEISDTSSFVGNRFFTDKVKDDLSLINVSFDYLMSGNIVQGATYCITKKTQEMYLKLHNETLYHDHQLLLIAAKIGSVYFLNEKLIRYRIHGKNTIGFGTKTNIFGLKRLKFPKLEPSMVTFLKQLHKLSKVDHFYTYVLYYYLRIPSLRNIFKTLF